MLRCYPAYTFSGWNCPLSGADPFGFSDAEVKTCALWQLGQIPTSKEVTFLQENKIFADTFSFFEVVF